MGCYTGLKGATDHLWMRQFMPHEGNGGLRISKKSADEARLIPTFWILRLVCLSPIYIQLGVHSLIPEQI